MESTQSHTTVGLGVGGSEQVHADGSKAMLRRLGHDVEEHVLTENLEGKEWPQSPEVRAIRCQKREIFCSIGDSPTAE